MQKFKNLIAFALILIIGLFSTNLVFGQGAGYQRFFQKISGENAIKPVSDFSLGTASDRVDVYADTFDALNLEISGVIDPGPLTVSGANASTIYGDGTKSIIGGDLGVNGFLDLDEISTPANPDANIGRFYVKDDGGTTKLYFRDSAGTETDLLNAAGVTTFLGLSDTPSSFTGSGGKLLAVNSGADSVEFIDAPGGETNTATNIGTAGVGVYKQKTGVEFELKKINTGDSNITITDDTGNDEIDVAITAEPTFDSLSIGSSSNVITDSSGTLTIAGVDVLDATTEATIEAAIDALSDIEILGHFYYTGEYDNGNSGTGKTIDWGNGNVQKITMTDNAVIEFTNPDGPGHFTLRSIQDVGGTNTYTFSGSILWNGGTEPNWTTVGDEINIHSCYFDSVQYYCDGWSES